MVVLNKWDLLSEEQARRISRIMKEPTEYSTIAFSCVTNYGMDDLLEKVKTSVAEL